MAVLTERHSATNQTFLIKAPEHCHVHNTLPCEKRARSQQRKVRFASITYTRDHISKEDLSPAECRAAWYSRRELRGCRTEIRYTIARHQGCSGAACDNGDNDDDTRRCQTLRGLAAFTTEGCRTRRRRHKSAIRTVLDIQQIARQGHEFSHNGHNKHSSEDEFLADVYSFSTKQNRHDAYRRGQRYELEEMGQRAFADI